jgi:transposase
LGTLFRLDYGLVLYDLTSTYFEGLAVENELAQRGYSRDHRSDCKQIVVALVVTKDGFPLGHRTFAGNTQDLKTVQTIVSEIETQGRAKGTLLFTPVLWISCDDDRCYARSRSGYPDYPEHVGE